MALEAMDRALKTLLSDKLCKIELFDNTYLNEPPESHINKADTFTTFLSTEIGGIIILNLPRHFTPFTEYDKRNNDLHTYWSDLANLCGDLFPKQIKLLYAYQERIALLDGYPNIKEYLERALIRNSFLWTQFVSESMLEAVQKISGPQGNVNSQMEIMNLPNHSNTQKKKILRFIKEVTNSLEEKDWSTNLKTFLDVNEKFLRLICWALQSIGLVDRNH